MQFLNSDGKYIFFFLNFLQPPSSFLGTMEEYIREAPRTAPVPNETIVSFFLFSFGSFNTLCDMGPWHAIQLI